MFICIKNIVDILLLIASKLSEFFLNDCPSSIVDQFVTRIEVLQLLINIKFLQFSVVLLSYFMHVIKIDLTVRPDKVNLIYKVKELNLFIERRVVHDGLNESLGEEAGIQRPWRIDEHYQTVLNICLFVLVFSQKVEQL